MAYGQSFPDDEIRSIMGRSIPPEWTVNVLSMGKEPWKFKDFDDQLNTYRQQWQADQQKKMLKMAGKSPVRSREGKPNNSKRNAHKNNSGSNGGRHNNSRQGGRRRGRGGRRGNNHDQNNHFKNLTCYNCDKKDNIPRTARHPRKMEMKTQTWFQKQISNICFNPHLKRCLPKRKSRKNKKHPPIWIKSIWT
jgi:hypothetical protein